MKTSNMDYEKKYKEALEKIRSLHRDYNQISTLIDVKEELENIFPELKESEGERMKKSLKRIIASFHDCNFPTPEGFTRKELFDWLESQGEQKPVDKIQIGKKYKCIASPRYSTFVKGLIYRPEDKFLCSLMNFCSDCFGPIEDGEQKPTKEYNITGIGSKNAQGKLGEMINNLKPVNEVLEQNPWSEEDERKINYLIALLQNSTMNDDALRVMNEEVENWLKYLKDRVQPQHKQEWSEEDKVILEKCIGAVKVSCYSYSFKSEAENWLKSLRPQPTWKPTEQQMKVLNEVINFAADHGTMRWNDYIYNVLKDLREQLKKL